MKKLILIFCVLSIQACSSNTNVAGASAGGPEEMLIVRGYNLNSPCDAAIIGTGNTPPVGPKEPLTDLSVSCGSSKKVTIQQLRQPLPNAHACVTFLRKLRDKNKLTQLVADPTPENQYHCLLSVITPNQFIAGSKWEN